MPNDEVFREPTPDLPRIEAMELTSYLIAHSRLSKIGMYLYFTLKPWIWLTRSQNSSLDMHHQIFLRLMGGKLTFAPLDRYPPKRILDVGTGTGIWALDMAE